MLSSMWFDPQLERPPCYYVPVVQCRGVDNTVVMFVPLLILRCRGVLFFDDLTKHENATCPLIRLVWIGVSIHTLHVSPELFASERGGLSVIGMVRSHMHVVHMLPTSVIAQRHELRPGLIRQGSERRSRQSVVRRSWLLVSQPALTYICKNESHSF